MFSFNLIRSLHSRWWRVAGTSKSRLQVALSSVFYTYELKLLYYSNTLAFDSDSPMRCRVWSTTTRFDLQRKYKKTLLIRVVIVIQNTYSV